MLKVPPAVIEVPPLFGEVVAAAGPGASRAPSRPARAAQPVPVHLLQEGEPLRASGADFEYVRMLADLETELPPILVQRGTMRVIDGAHRLRAARLRNVERIMVEFFDGSDRACFVRAVEENVGNGLQLTLQDRKRCAGRIVTSYPEWSDRLIASKAGLSTKTVTSIRLGICTGVEQPESRIGADGRVRPVNVAEGRLRAGEVLARNPQASLREMARLAGISVGTARDVRERVRQGRSLIPDGQSRQDAGPSTIEARPAGPEPVNLAGLLESLRRDPTLRYSVEGRSLVRWLDARIIRSEEMDYAAHVPSHQAAVIAKAARACASLWEDIAQGLERRLLDHEC